MKRPRPLTAGRQTPKVDLVMKGIAFGVGPRRDRFRVASETRDKDIYHSRRAMYRDLYRRMFWEPLEERAAGRITTAALHNAYQRGGDPAVKALLTERKGTLLAELLPQFEKVNKRDKGGHRHYCLVTFLAYLGAAALVDDFTTAAVQDFLATVEPGRKEMNSLTDATRNRYRAYLSSFATWLVALKHLKEHPIAFKRVRKLQDSVPRKPKHTPAEIQAYLDAVRTEGSDEAHLAVWCLMSLGCDVGELMVSTVRSVHLDDTHPHADFRRTKTMTPERTVPIPSALAAAVRAHVARWGLGADDRLFRMLGRYALEGAHQRAKVTANVPGLRLKDLRHLAAIAWRRAGADLQETKELLGHASITQTVVYTDVEADKSDSAALAERAAGVWRTE